MTEPVVRRTNSVFSSPFAPGGPDQDLRERMQTSIYGEAETDTRQEERRADSPEARAKRAREAKRDQNARGINQGRKEGVEEQVYVNGRLVTIYNLYDADGNPQQVMTYGGYRTDGGAIDLGEAEKRLGSLTPGQKREYENRENQRAATFGILGMGALEDRAQDTFILGYGEKLDEDGKTFTQSDRGKALEEDRAFRGLPTSKTPGRGQHAGAKRSQPQSVTNRMTVQGGVTWFRKLSNADPATFDEYIDLLVGSGYLSEDAARKGAYTLAAGKAFAEATVDAAQNAEVGMKDDLQTFLQKQSEQVAAAMKEARAAAYEPITRQYTDPTALASVARQEAERLLGRSLSDEEAAGFADRFKGLETNKYEQIDAAGRAGGSATVTDPNATGQAEAFVRGPQYDGERTKQMTGNYMDALNKLLGG